MKSGEPPKIDPEWLASVRDAGRDGFRAAPPDMIPPDLRARILAEPAPPPPVRIDPRIRPMSAAEAIELRRALEVNSAEVAALAVALTRHSDELRANTDALDRSIRATRDDDGETWKGQD